MDQSSYELRRIADSLSTGSNSSSPTVNVSGPDIDMSKLSEVASSLELLALLRCAEWELGHSGLEEDGQKALVEKWNQKIHKSLEKMEKLEEESDRKDREKQANMIGWGRQLTPESDRTKMAEWDKEAIENPDANHYNAYKLKYREQLKEQEKKKEKTNSSSI